MYKNLRRTFATVTQGEPRILQAPDSDVSLHIPEGSEGLFTMKVHTDHTRFPGVIPDKECIISPIVEIEHKKQEEKIKDKDSPFYTVKIPHSLRNIAQYKTVRVKRGEGYKKIIFHELPLRSEADRESYEIDEKFIKIFTRKFSTFVCTSCGNSCQATVMLFLLGYLEQRQETNDTLTQIKSFLCSDLYSIKDFREVSESHFNLNIEIFDQKNLKS